MNVKGPAPSSIEIERRKFMTARRDLYDYIEALVAAREWERAGDTVSGASDGYSAANRAWSESHRWRDRRDAMRSPEPAGQDRPPGQDFTDLAAGLRAFLDRPDVAERLPMHLAADLDQLVTDAELDVARRDGR